jgi:hypothetical protein
MYLRFVSPLRSDEHGGYLGIFQAAFECRDDEFQPYYLTDIIREEIEWFKKHLPSPDSHVFDVRGRCWKAALGICWFRSEARAMIAHAFTVRAILEECGYPIKTIGTRKPGDILYEDDFQIVAKPEKTTPTHWG